MLCCIRVPLAFVEGALSSCRGGIPARCIRATRHRLETRSEEVEATISSLMAQSAPGMKELNEEEAANQLFSLTVFACYEHVDNKTVAEVLQGAEKLDDEKSSAIFRDVLSARRPSRAQVELYESVVQEEQARLIEQMTPDEMPGALGNIGRKMSTATKAAYVIAVLAGHPSEHLEISSVMAYRQVSSDSHGGRSTPGAGELHEVDPNNTLNFKNRAPSKANATPSKGAGLAGLSLRKNMGAAQVKIETPRTGRRVSGAGHDFFDGENIDDIVKSLISTKKIDSAWQRISRRVATLETYIQYIRGGEGDDTFITRKEFIEFLKSQEAEEEQEEEGTDEAAQGGEPEEPKEDPILVELREALKAQEDANANALKQAMEGARKADEAKWVRVGDLEEKCRKLQEALAEERSERLSGEAAFTEQLKSISTALEDLEPRMQAFATSEARRHISQLLFGESEAEAWIDDSELPRAMEGSSDADGTEAPGSARGGAGAEGPGESLPEARPNTATLEVPNPLPTRPPSSASARPPSSASAVMPEARWQLWGICLFMKPFGWSSMDWECQHQGSGGPLRKVLQAATVTSDGLCRNAYELGTQLSFAAPSAGTCRLFEDAARNTGARKLVATLTWRTAGDTSEDEEQQRRGGGSRSLHPDDDDYEMKVVPADPWLVRSRSGFQESHDDAQRETRLLRLQISHLTSRISKGGRAATIRHYMEVKDELELELMALNMKATEMHDFPSWASTVSTCDTAASKDAVGQLESGGDFGRESQLGL
ncbi:unnamed protein product [Symbiodinium natans]|uniref:Uncharacterized protein n=1 Tax=Symbiodinium natans TaxID=878477 RepID=A0A812UL86_9DINO|nr:unnamed protein product [Symbiodinium natans]